MLPKINPEHTKAWQDLDEHFAQNDFELSTLFQYNPNRFKEHCIERPDYIFDFSKNLVDSRTMELLLALAEETKVKDAIKSMFSGEKSTRQKTEQFYIQR